MKFLTFMDIDILLTLKVIIMRKNNLINFLKFNNKNIFFKKFKIVKLN